MVPSVARSPVVFMKLKEDGVASDKRLLSEQFPRASQYNPDWLLANASGGGHFPLLAQWAPPTQRPPPRHAGAGPRLRPGLVVDLFTARIRRAGLGHGFVVQRLGESPENPGRRRRG